MQINHKISSVVEPDSPGAKTAFKVRKKIYECLESKIDLESLQNILDVGASPDEQAAYSNFFEYFYPHKSRITALSEQDASNLEKIFPGLKFVRADGRFLPFADNTFDLVFSSAVLEHVGNFEQQKQFVAEAFRVSRKYIFLTTPNRWHPFEFHTYFPLLHWLPKRLHRRILRWLHLDYLADEEHLNLLSERDLHKICRELDIDAKIYHVNFLFCKSNLLLTAVKNG